MKGLDLSKMTALERLDFEAEVDSYIELLKTLRDSGKKSSLELGVEARTFHQKQENIDFPLLAKVNYVSDWGEFEIFFKTASVLTGPVAAVASSTMYAYNELLRDTASLMWVMKKTAITTRQGLLPHFTQEQLDEFPNVIGWYLREYQ